MSLLSRWLASRRGSGLGASYQQEVDLQNHDVTEYVGQASVPEQVRHLIDRAVRIAHNRRGVICVILPNDLQELQYADPPVAHGATHTGVGYAGPAKLPDDPLLAAAADVLNAGKKVAMLVAAGALDATDEIIAVAERLQARRESSARQGRRARRSSVRDRFDRIARDEAELGSHEGL
jgi:pyruvate dehydrogenase (quinone)